MRLSAGRIRSINRTLARINGASYLTQERRIQPLPAPQTANSSVVPPHTIRIVAVPKPLAA